MMRAFHVLLVGLLALSACNMLPPDDGGGNSPEATLMLINNAEKALAYEEAVALSTENELSPEGIAASVEPPPTMRSQLFERRRIAPGDSMEITDITGFDGDQSVALFLYAKPSSQEDNSATAAVYAQLMRVPSEMLKRQNNRVLGVCCV